MAMRDHDLQRNGRDLWTEILSDGREVIRLFKEDTSDTSFERLTIGPNADGQFIIKSEAGTAGGTVRDVVLAVGDSVSMAFGAPLSSAAAPTVTPQTPGSTGYTYRITAYKADGTHAARGATTATTTGAANLTAGSSANVITWAAVTGASYYAVERTASSGTPSTTGVLGTTTALTYTDNGSTTPTQAGPAYNNSGAFVPVNGISLTSGTIDISSHSPSTTAAIAANGTILGSGGVWTTFSAEGAAGIKLLLENSCNTGTFASLRIRGRAYNTTSSGNGNASVGVTMAGDFSASANKAEYGNLFAINACAQPNAYAQTTDATNIVCALYGRIDATAASGGRRWVSWLDTHATTKAGASDYMERISHNGTQALDGCWSIYNGGRLPLLFNFEDVAGFAATAAGTTLTVTHKLAVKFAGDATTYYIPVGTLS